MQLALNAAWTPIFFGLRRPGWALAELVLLWGAIAATLVAFRPLHRGAASLLVPYLIWVAFAGALKKKRGLQVTSEKAEGGERVYRLADA